MLRESAEGVASRAAGIDHGRNACVDAGKVGVHSGLVHAVVDVRVQVDHTGDDQLAIDLHHAGVGAGSDVRGELGYRAILDRYIHLGVNSL